MGLSPPVAPHVLSFDVVNPLQSIGSSAIRKRLEEWFSSFKGLVGHEIRDLKVDVGDSVAFSHGLNHVIGTSQTGRTLTCASLATSKPANDGHLKTGQWPPPAVW